MSIRNIKWIDHCICLLLDSRHSSNSIQEDNWTKIWSHWGLSKITGEGSPQDTIRRSAEERVATVPSNFLAYPHDSVTPHSLCSVIIGSTVLFWVRSTQFSSPSKLSRTFPSLTSTSWQTKQLSGGDLLLLLSYSKLVKFSASNFVFGKALIISQPLMLLQ